MSQHPSKIVSTQKNSLSITQFPHHEHFFFIIKKKTKLWFLILKIIAPWIFVVYKKNCIFIWIIIIMLPYQFQNITFNIIFIISRWMNINIFCYKNSIINLYSSPVILFCILLSNWSSSAPQIFIYYIKFKIIETTEWSLSSKGYYFMLPQFNILKINFFSCTYIL